MRYRAKKTHKLLLCITAFVALISLIMSRYTLYGAYVCMISLICLCGVCLLVIRDIFLQIKEQKDVEK